MDELLRLLDDARADERRAGRGRERMLRQLAEETATLSGTLIDLAERGSVVTLRTSSGRAHHGVVRLVAADFCVLGAASGDVWLALVGLTSVRPHPGERHDPATGERAAVDLLLGEALARVATHRPRLTVACEGGERMAGDLVAVGTDVLTIRLDGDVRAVCYVSVSSIRAVFRSG